MHSTGVLNASVFVLVHVRFTSSSLAYEKLRHGDTRFTVTIGLLAGKLTFTTFAGVYVENNNGASTTVFCGGGHVVIELLSSHSLLSLLSIRIKANFYHFI